MRGQGAGIAGFARGPLGLQAVTFGKDKGGGAGDSLCCQALWEPFGDEGRGGGGAVAQGTQGDGIAALQGAGVAGDGGDDFTTAEPILCHVLIGDDEIKEKPGSGGEGGDDPCGEAVGVDGDAQGGGALACAGQIAVQAVFQEGDLTEMGDQAQAGGGGDAGLAADDQQGADTLFQRFDPLGDGGGGQAKLGCGQIKGATAVDGSKRGELGVIEHEFSGVRDGLRLIRFMQMQKNEFV